MIPPLARTLGPLGISRPAPIVSPGIAVVVSGSKGGGGASGVTTDAADTTHAGLIIVGVASFNALTTLNDNKGNTWTGLTDRVQTGAVRYRLYYCASPTVGSGHTFTAAGTNVYPALFYLAVSGAAAAPFEAESGNNGASLTSIAPGSLTPSAPGALVVAGFGGSAGSSISVGSGFTTLSTNYAASQNMAGALGYVVQGPAPAASNPTISWTGTAHAAAAQAVFLAA